MLAQLYFILEIFHLVLQPAFAHAKMYEHGGGARFALKHLTIKRDSLRAIKSVKDLKCWEQVKKIDSEISRTLFFHAATRVVGAMLQTTEGHWRHAASNLILSLADPDLQGPMSDVLFDYMVMANVTPPETDEKSNPFSNARPAYTYFCGGEQRKLESSPEDIAMEVRAYLEVSGGHKASCMLHTLTLLTCRSLILPPPPSP